MIQRLLLVALLLPMVIYLFWLGGWYTHTLLLVAAGICLFEYGEIVARKDKLGRALLMVLGLSGLAAAFVVDNAVSAMLLIQAVCIVFACVYTLTAREDMAAAWRSIVTLSFGFVYIGLGFVAIDRLRLIGDGAAFDEKSRVGVVIIALAATWWNDTGAYFAGRNFGKHKLAEYISPKKTWEGFFGGAIAAIVMMFAMRAVFSGVFSQITVVDILMIGIPAAVLAPLGDLAESMMKRAYDVKDSGAILPGHGGMLDRLDAVFFVAPWVVGYWLVIRPMMG